jgi:hypothetical protein
MIAELLGNATGSSENPSDPMPEPAIPLYPPSRTLCQSAGGRHKRVRKLSHQLIATVSQVIKSRFLNVHAVFKSRFLHTYLRYNFS